MKADHGSVRWNGAIAFRHADLVAALTGRDDMLLVADDPAGAHLVPTVDAARMFRDNTLVTHAPVAAIAHHEPMVLLDPRLPHRKFVSGRDIHHTARSAHRVVKVRQHRDAWLHTRSFHQRFDVPDNQGVQVDVKQIVVTERAIGIEQFHLRPPAMQAAVLQGDCSDTCNRRQARHADGPQPHCIQLVVQKSCVPLIVFGARA